MKVPEPSFSSPGVGCETAIMSVLPFPALIFDIASFMVLRSNAHFCNQCGWLPDVLQKSGFDFLGECDFTKMTETIASEQNYIVHKLHETTEEIKTFEVQACPLPGLKISFLYINLLSAHKLSEIQEVENSILNFKNITGPLLMKELYMARGKAHEAERLKTTFLTNMSHEVRTPLNSILGLSTVLKNTGINSPKWEQYLDIIISSGNHLMQIMNDLIDITRLEGNQIQVFSAPIILNDALDDICKNFSNDIKTSRKRIKLNLCKPLANENSLIISDLQHITRVYTILLNNALKFTNEGFIEFGYQLNDGKYLFYVKDTGIGIPEDAKPIIFERFRQVDESFTRDYGGLGLGLSICKGLVELMGGKIWVESDGKTGSAFLFTLDVEQDIVSFPGSEVLARMSAPKGNWEYKYILVVEDDMANFEYLNEILTSMGCTVLHAKDGAEAMKIFDQAPVIDLILLDLQVPGMDGYEIARLIRNINQDIPIVAQTAHALSEHKKKCFETGFNRFLTKPIHLSTLVDELKAYLG